MSRRRSPSIAERPGQRTLTQQGNTAYRVCRLAKVHIPTYTDCSNMSMTSLQPILTSPLACRRCQRQVAGKSRASRATYCTTTSSTAGRSHLRSAQLCQLTVPRTRPATETEASLSLVLQYGTVCQLHCGVMM